MSPITRFATRIDAALKAFRNPPSATKHYGYAGMNAVDLTRGSASAVAFSKYGAATALLVNHAVFACVTKRAETIVGLPYRVVDRDTRKELDAKEEPLMRMLANYSRHYGGTSIFQEWMYDRDVTGEVYVELLRDKYSGRVVGVDLLSSLNVTPWSTDGVHIEGFEYSAGMQYAMLPPDALVYDRNTVARMSMIHGYSPVLVAVGSNSAGIMQAAGKAALAYFNNDGVPSTIIQPPGADDEYSEAEVAFIRRMFQPVKHASGKYATAIMPYRADVVTLAQPDLMKWAELLAGFEPQIYTAFRTPRSIAGDSDSTRYQASPHDRTNYDLMIGATADDIAQVINTSILPQIYNDPEPSVEFEFETASLDHIDPEERQAANEAYDRGAITLNEYRDVLGYEPVANGDVYKIQSGAEFVTTDAFKPQAREPEPQPITVQTPPPAQLPANIPERTPVDELEAFGKFVRAGKTEKRAFVWNVVDGETAAVIEAEIAQAEPSAVKSVIAEWRDVFNADQGVTDFDAKAYSNLPEATQEYVSALYGMSYTASVVNEAAAKHYAGVIAGKRTTGVTQLRFNNEFTRLMQRAAEERIGKAVFIRNMTILLDRYCRQAFTDGFYDGGVYGYEPLDDDEQWIFKHVDGQQGFITQFAAKLYADDELTADEIAAKPDLWWSGSILPAYSEGLLRASKDGAGRWRLGASEKHCNDCPRLHGKVYRFSTWKKLLGGSLPPCDATQCTKLGCNCTVEPTREPLTKGRPPALQGARKHIEVHAHDHA
jgi:HK97 family phage portal protein